MRDLAAEVEALVATLDKERRKGFCDERGILRIWAQDLINRTKSAYDVGHKEAVSRAKTCEGALEEIVTNPSLSKQKIKLIAGNAIAKARRLRDAQH